LPVGYIKFFYRINKTKMYLKNLWVCGFVGLIATLSIVAAGQNHVRMSITDSGYKRGFEIIGKKYQEIHPDVTVSVQIIPGDGYATWIRAAIAGGDQTAPDIFNINMTQGYFEAGKAISLKPYLLGTNPYTGKPWIESFHREYIQMLRVGGDYPQAPLNFVEIGFFYNKDIFQKVEAKSPETWKDYMDVCRKIQDAGYIPVSIGGDLDSYWQGTVGWVVRVLCDAYFFETVPLVMARPGDFVYDPETDEKYRPDPNNPYCDLLVNIPRERTLQAILDGEISFDGPQMREIYTRLRQFSQFWQKGYNGANAAMAYQLFFTQKAAMTLSASPTVMSLEYDMKDLSPADRFDWGIFRIPSISDSPLVRIKTRGAGGPLPVYGVIRKNKEQHDVVADFLMFLMRPESCRIVMEETLEDEQALAGPFAIKDVPMPPDMEEKFKPFFGLGREKIEFRGLMDEQESVWRWCILAQDYMADRMSLDKFLEEYQLLMLQAIPRVIRMQDLDMNPRTRDNNLPLLREIEAFFQELRTGKRQIPKTSELFVKEFSGRLKDLSRSCKIPEQEFFDLIVERTLPLKILGARQAFDEENMRASETCRKTSCQYLIFVHLSDGQFDYRIHNFRPSLKEVVTSLHGKRYSGEQLKKILHLD